MSPSKFILSALCVATLGLAACSSSFGDGSRPPHDTTVVVPPNGSSTTTTHNSTTTTSPQPY